jgi:hypothetical protein
VSEQEAQPDHKMPVYRGEAAHAPYALSVSSPKIEAIDKRLLKATAHESMMHQAQQQMDLLKKQAALIMEQVRNIEQRLELSHKIYQADMGFEPVIGGTYFFYLKKNGSYALSMVAPQEWGMSMPYQSCEACVRLLPDKTWEVLES